MKRFAILAALVVAAVVGMTTFNALRQGDVSATTLDTGYLNPSTNAAACGGFGFEYPEGAYTYGSGAALSSNSSDNCELYGGYDASVPSGATISGIEVRADWWMDMGLEAELTVCLSWNRGTNSACKTDSALDVPTERIAVLGGPTDLWGHTWTTDELSNSNLVAQVQFTSRFSGSSFFLLSGLFVLLFGLSKYRIGWVAIETKGSPERRE